MAAKKETVSFEIESNLTEFLKELEAAGKHWKELDSIVTDVNKSFDMTVGYLNLINESIGKMGSKFAGVNKNVQVVLKAQEKMTDAANTGAADVDKNKKVYKNAFDEISDTIRSRFAESETNLRNFGRESRRAENAIDNLKFTISQLERENIDPTIILGKDSEKAIKDFENGLLDAARTAEKLSVIQNISIQIEEANKKLDRQKEIVQMSSVYQEKLLKDQQALVTAKIEALRNDEGVLDRNEKLEVLYKEQQAILLKMQVGETEAEKILAAKAAAYQKTSEFANKEVQARLKAIKVEKDLIKAKSKGKFSLKDQKAMMALRKEEFKLKAGPAINAAKGMQSAISGALGMLSKIPGAGMLAGAGLSVLVDILAGADKKFKDLQKSISSMIAASGTSTEQFTKLDKATGQWVSDAGAFERATGDRIRDISNLSAEMHVNMETAMAWQTSMKGAGFTINQVTSESTKNISALATRFDQSFEEMAGQAGTLKEEFGYSLDRATSALTGLEGAAAASGMTMSRFLAKAVNAASGLAIYGTKVEDVGKLMNGFIKGMKMSPKLAEEMTSAVTGSMKNMTWQQKQLILQNSSFSKGLENARQAGAGGWKQFSELIGESDDAAKQLFQRFIRGGANIEEVWQKANPSKWFEVQAEAVLSKGLNLDINSNVGDIADKINNASAQTMGSLEVIMEKTAGWNKDQVLAFKQFANDQKIVDEKQFKKTGKHITMTETLHKFNKHQAAVNRADAIKRDRAADEMIKKQTRPVTEAIEQWIERMTIKLYFGVMKIYNYLRKKTASPKEKAEITMQELSLDKQNELLDINDAIKKATESGDNETVKQLMQQKTKIQEDSRAYEKVADAISKMKEDSPEALKAAEAATKIQDAVDEQRKARRMSGKGSGGRFVEEQAELKKSDFLYFLGPLGMAAAGAMRVGQGTASAATGKKNWKNYEGEQAWNEKSAMFDLGEVANVDMPTTAGPAVSLGFSPTTPGVTPIPDVGSAGQDNRTINNNTYIDVKSTKEAVAAQRGIAREENYIMLQKPSGT